MNCDETARKLSLYLDRELSRGEIAEVRHHLEDCPPCAQMFEFQASLQRLVRKECCSDGAPERLREWVRRLAKQSSEEN